MIRFLALAATVSLLVLLASCRSAKGTGEATQPQPEVKLIGAGTSLPKATVFTMSGDYAGNVAVTLGPDGKLTYYPAPSDLTLDSKPFPLGDGWYLNRQGFGPGSVFTKWSFEEYMAMPQAPSLSEILEAVIPGAVVTEFVTTSVPLWEAIQDPEACMPFLK